ncbi:hypothetical protein I6N96_07670 [Enterococcus sp. BWM-S5]|uniref:LPXTG cell wall anchor domain-containing protein n=1 Tax=Enterococcus larvae TaxID=2794352 RepID=A0ABS4CHQ7_9ENTE|nr:hypothetical protein [Enterococcus larvae]MBP1046158.1 hypothetical protein [Enterococcus larvae]
MKKLIFTALLAVGFFVGASEAKAEEVSVITPAEQQVIDSAQAWVGPLWNATYTAKAEYWAKNVDLSQADADTVMGNMFDAARLINQAGVGYDSFSDYNSLIAKLQEVDPNIASQVIALAAEISSLTGVNTNGDLIVAPTPETPETPTDNTTTPNEENGTTTNNKTETGSESKGTNTTLRSGNSSNGNIMKNTGVSYMNSLAMIILVGVAGLGAMFVSKKQQIK